MRILALMWPTNGREDLMINRRGDMVCPAIDGITDALMELGHTVVYVNLHPDDTDLISHISGLKFHRWKNIANRQFDLVWHAIKDPTPEVAIPHVERMMEELQGIPVLNPVSSLRHHTKSRYLKLLGEKHVGTPLYPEYAGFLNEQGKLDNSKCMPPSNGAVVSKDVPDYALMVGVPARQTGWVSRHGLPLKDPDVDGVMVCPESGLRYKEIEPGIIRCLDLDEEQPLPAELAVGKTPYDEFKKR